MVTSSNISILHEKLPVREVLTGGSGENKSIRKRERQEERHKKREREREAKDGT